jgi:pimeloyl-ACP methyl ester carboxylesterase
MAHPAAAPSVARGRRPARLLRMLLIALALGVACWLGFSAWLARFYVTRPVAPYPEPVPKLDWATIEEARLTAADGEHVGFWFLPAPAKAAPDDAPTVLCLHGHTGDRGWMLPVLKVFHDAGFPTAAISFRAHGDSTGDYNDIGYGGRLDVIAAVAEIARRRPGKPIVVQGSSLGAAAAIYAAGDLGPRVCGYILECPFRDITTAVENRLRLSLPWGARQVVSEGLRLLAPVMIPTLKQMSPINAIGAIPADVPVLMIAGGRDPLATPAEARELHATIPGHSELVFFEDAGHVLYAHHDPARYKALAVPFARKAANGCH